MTNDEKRIIELEQEVKMLRSVLGAVDEIRREANVRLHSNPDHGARPLSWSRNGSYADLDLPVTTPYTDTSHERLKA